MAGAAPRWFDLSSISVLFVSALAGLGAGIYILLAIDQPALASAFVPESRARLWQANPPWYLLAAPMGLAVVGTGLAMAWGGRGLAVEPRRTLRWRLALAQAWVLLPVAQMGILLAAAGNPGWLTPIILSAPLCVALSLAGWSTTLWTATCPPFADDQTAEESNWRNRRLMLLAAMGLYTLAFGGLAALQYAALHVPHGDSGMYEEHLWNLLHGRGLRSQLDGGRSFLGEHLEVIHVLLLPLYAMLPSLLTLQWIESAALSSCGLAVWMLARRHGAGPGACFWLGIATLAYFPLQCLDLEASWKTFRPETLGVPLLLYALVAWTRGHYRTMGLLLLLTVLAKEDYAIVVAALGLYIAALPMDRVAAMPRTTADQTDDGAAEWSDSQRVTLGLGIAAVSVALLAWTLLWLIPYFRAGAAPHYTPYFASFGETPLEIVRTLASRPGLWLSRLTQPRSLQFVILLLLPLGGLPLARPLRFLVAAPTFAYLMLADLPILTQPWFHFHAPLVPILLWGTVGGVERLRNWWSPLTLARWVACLTLITGIWYGRGPLSWSFHDPASRTERQGGIFVPRGDYWRDVYVPGERARRFPRLADFVQETDKVAATDYLRSRYTHHAAAHDYPLRDHVAIDDVDVIVLDKTEGWWGRGPTNPDRQLLTALDANLPVGSRILVRGEPFEIRYHDEYFLLVRKVQ